MTALEKLRAEKALREDRAKEEIAGVKATRAKIAKEEQRLARVRQAKIGALADAAGLDGVTLDTWRTVFACVANFGSTDATVRDLVEIMTQSQEATR